MVGEAEQLMSDEFLISPSRPWGSGALREELGNESLGELDSNPESSTDRDSGSYWAPLKPYLAINSDYKALHAGMSLSGVCIVLAIHHLDQAKCQPALAVSTWLLS